MQDLSPTVVDGCENHKGKIYPWTSHESPGGEQMYSFTLSSTLALDGVGGQRHAPATLPQGRTRYLLYSGWVGPRAGMDGCEKSGPPPGFDPWTVHPVASRYTDWAIPALTWKWWYSPTYMYVYIDTYIPEGFHKLRWMSGWALCLK
jgi:hypothetical protein